MIRFKEKKMEQEVTNFGRFYALFNALPGVYDKDGTKRALVAQHTGGRTESLREMSRREYEDMCRNLEAAAGHREELRRARSATLRLMQKVGIDTADWSRVNAFCRDPRIAGMDFARLSPEDLAQLRRKIRAIGLKGGLSAKPAPRRPEPETRKETIIMLSPAGEA